MYCAYVTRIRNLRKHTNADRLLCGECFGNTVIVDLGTDPDQLGVYFPTDGKLGLEFAQKNDLLRRKDENGAPAGGYLDPEKRNIKALKLRGEKSDGLFLPLSCLASFTDIKKLQEGDTISVLNGITICEKYIPAVKRASGSGGGGNHVRKRSDPISPLFQEHADTEQLAYNLSAFHAGDLVEVTLKMHGTSQRTGYLPVLQGYKYRNRMEKRLYESRKTPNVIRSKIKRAPIYDWGYVTGTRRVVLGTFDEGGYYGNNAFREKHAKVFEGKLYKGETVYYEVVGFTDDGTPIMNPGNNSKLNDKEFTKQYGKTTTFSYPNNTYIAKIGDGAFLAPPYVRIERGPDSRLFCHNPGFGCNRLFVPIDELTPDNINRICTYHPRAMLGGEIESYQTETIPIFLHQLSKLFPEQYSAFIKAFPDYELKAPDYRGKYAKLSTCNRELTYRDAHGNSFRFDGDKLVCDKYRIGGFMPFSSSGYAQMRIPVTDDMQVKITDSNQVTDQTVLM